MKKLSTEQQAELIRLYKSGVSVKALARKYKRGVSTIYDSYLNKTVKTNATNSEGLLVKALEVHSEYDRKLYDWFAAYAKECGFTVKQLIKLLILKEQSRAAKGEQK